MYAIRSYCGLRLQHEDALHEHDVRGLERLRLGQAAVGGVVVAGHGDRLAPPQLLEVRDQQLGVEGLGVVVVDAGALFQGQVAVVVVVGVA